VNEEQAIKRAEYLIENGYVEDKEVKQLAKEILKSINNTVDRGTAIPTDSSTDKE
jgi:TPP-dependent pyruvate/acetoin dehydrogenase alpha subunit